MFTTVELEQAKPIADGLIYGGGVRAKQGTPLSLITGLALPTMVDDESDILENISKAASHATPDGYRQHDADLGNLTKAVSQRVSATLNYAKNTINPLVRDIIQDLPTLATANQNGIDNCCDIVIKGIPTVYTANALGGLLQSVGTPASDSRPLPGRTADFILTDLTIDAAKDFIRFNETFDTAVKELILTIEDLKDALVEERALVTHPEFCVLDDTNPVLAMIFLMGVRNRLELTGEQRAEVNSAIAYHAATIIRNRNLFNGYLKENRLIVGTTPNAVYVFDLIYSDWIQSKGSPEAVMGWFARTGKVDRASSVASKDLYVSPETYVKHYERIKRTEEASAHVHMRSQINTIIRRKLLEYVRDEIEDTGQRQEAITRINDFLDRNVYTANMDIDTFVLRAVCCALEKENSDAFFVLSTMRELMQENGLMTPSAASVCATASLVVRWATRQVESN